MSDPADRRPAPADDPTDDPADPAAADVAATDEATDQAGTGSSSEEPTGTAPPPPPPPPSGVTAPTRPSPHDASHPSGLSESARNYGMFIHLSSFAGLMVSGMSFLGPLVLWLVRRDEHPFIDHHGKEAINFNLSLLLYGVIGVIASIVTFGLGLVVAVPAILVFFVVWIATTIQAAIRANRGEGYRYPLTIRFLGD